MPTMLPRMVILPVLAALLGTACSGGSSIVAAEAGVLPDGAGPPIPVRCDVVGQGCPSGKRCDFACENGNLVIACVPEAANPGPLGATCGNGVDGGAGTGSSCGTGTGCFGQAGKPPMCYRYCKSGSDCPTGTTCNTTTRFRAACPKGGGELPVGLCL
jgi:hypothetical protein